MCIESLTVIRTNSAEIVTIYNKYDGYPSGCGRDLAEMVVAGGTDIGTLTVKIITRLKAQSNDVRLLPVGSSVGWHGYLYEVTALDDNKVVMRITCKGIVQFEGSVMDCLTFCMNQD